MSKAVEAVEVWKLVKLYGGVTSKDLCVKSAIRTFTWSGETYKTNTA